MAKLTHDLARVPEPSRRRRLKSSLVIVLLGVLSAGAAAAADETPCTDPPPADPREYTVGVNVTWGAPTALVPIPNLYAWEEAEVVVSDAVNVNREIYEERKCNWFGINCWYEKRVRNNPVDATRIAFNYFSAGLGKNDKQIVIVVNAGSPVSTDYNAYWGGATTADSRTLSGLIGDDNSGINRTSCEGEPRVCSVGAYTVKFKVDSAPRAFRLLSELSKQAYSYDALMSSEILNANLRQSGPKVRECLARALYGQATLFHGPGANSTAAERQKILQQALAFNPKDDDVRTALGSTYLETGQFDEARKQTTEVIGDLERKAKGGTADETTYDKLAQNYATLAETSWRETAGDSTRAAIEAAGALRLSLERLNTRLREFPLKPGAVTARSRLIDNSIRLAQVQSRLGTVQDLAGAVSVIADARDKLPRRMDNLVALESDAVGGTVAFSRADGPLFSDRGWKLDVRHLAVTNGQTITPFGVDPADGMRAAVFRAGGTAPSVQALEVLLSDGRAPDTSALSKVCLHQAAMLNKKAPRGVIWDPATKANQLSDLLSTKGKKLGPIGGFALTRGSVERLVTLAWDDDVEKWSLSSWKAGDLGVEPTVAVLAGGASDHPLLRVAPGGQFYAVGVRAPGRAQRSWTLFDEKLEKSRPIGCTAPDKQPAEIDDIAFVQSGDSTGRLKVVGIGEHCIARVADAQVEKDLSLISPEGDVGRASAANVLHGRTAAFAWATKEGEPLAVMSWDRDAKPPKATSTYKLHVLRWTFTEKEQSATHAPAFHADIAPWAIAPSNAPACEGAAPGALTPVERFRITGLSVVSEKSREGAEFERPRIEAVVAGVYGAVAVRERQRAEDKVPAAPPVAVGGGAVVQAAAQERSQTGSEQPRQMAVSAVCNAGGLRDFQIGDDRRIWAVRRDDLGIVRLLGPGQEACEGPSLAMASKDQDLRRLYAAPRKDTSNPNLQVLDLNAKNLVERLTVATPPGDAAKKEGPQPAIAAPETCGLSKVVEPGSCDAKALRTALGLGDKGEVGVLVRDTSTDPGLADQKMRFPEFRETVERVTHLTFTGPIKDGKNTITVVPFPLAAEFAPNSFPVPEGAEALAVLDAKDGPLLIAAVGTKVAAYNRSGEERGWVDVEEPFLKPGTSRRLFAGTRVVLVARGDAGAAAAMKVLAVKDGVLTAPKCEGCTLQTDAAVRELSKQLRIGPWLNPEGRIERFLTDGDLSTLVVARLGVDHKWQNWSGVSLDGAKVLELKSAGAGLPIMLEGDWAMIAPQPQTVELWSTKQ